VEKVDAPSIEGTTCHSGRIATDFVGKGYAWQRWDDEKGGRHISIC
jgi:catabolite regulation protein CreA